MTGPSEFPPLVVELADDGLITLVDPTDDGSGNLWRVRVHPAQLRWIAEQADLVREMSASDADMLRTERERAAQAIADLERLIPWLEMLETRCSQLHDNILGVGESGGEDVNIEIAQSAALADIAEQVLRDAQAALSRHVTPCHANVPAVSRGTDAVRAEGGKGGAPKVAPKPPIGGESGADGSIGNTPENGGVEVTQKRGSSGQAALVLEVVR